MDVQFSLTNNLTDSLTDNLTEKEILKGIKKIDYWNLNRSNIWIWLNSRAIGEWLFHDAVTGKLSQSYDGYCASALSVFFSMLSITAYCILSILDTLAKQYEYKFNVICVYYFIRIKLRIYILFLDLNAQKYGKSQLVRSDGDVSNKFPTLWYAI